MNGGLVPALVFGLGIGGGLTLVVRSLAARPAALVPSLQRLESVGVSVAGLELDRGGSRLGVSFERVARWGRLHSVSDLDVAGRSSERHGFDKMVSAIALGAIPVMAAVVAGLGGVVVPPGIALVLALSGIVAGGLLPELTLVSRARTRRRAFRHALSAYLDLVNVLLAGGAGVETALTAAADAGDGWVFEHIRDVLLRARTSRTSPWDAFADLGGRLGVDELIELAASVELAGERGARIRLSLIAKAEAMRGRQAAEVESDAQSATERMGLPTVLMFLGFLVLLGYPAAVMVVSGIGG